MDLITCYDDSLYPQEMRADGEANNDQIRRIEKLISFLKGRFSFASFTLIEPEEISGSSGNHFLINEGTEKIVFSLLLDFEYSGYEIFYECVLDIGFMSLTVSSRPLKYGLAFNLKRDNIINSLNRYFLCQNTKMHSSSMRINPIDGEIRLTYSIAVSANEMDFLLKNPEQIYILYEIEVGHMLKSWNRILYKLLWMINELPKDAMMNQKKKLEPKVEKHIKNIQEKIKEVANEVNQSYIEYSFMYENDGDSNVRFTTLANSELRSKTEKLKKSLDKIKPVKLNKECQRIAKKIFNIKEISKFEFAHQNLDKASNYRQILKINHSIASGPKILTNLRIHEVQNEMIMTCGGFADISRLMVIGSRDTEEENERKRISIIKKTSLNSKLFWESKLVRVMGDYQCLFIQKYFKPIVRDEVNINFDDSILMEFCPQKSLNSYLSAFEGMLSLPVKLYFLYQTSIGLRFLRDLGIVHLDVKPENILMKIYENGPNTKPRFLLQLIDFGESFLEDHRNSFQVQQYPSNIELKRGITIPYASPELVRNDNKFNEKSDVFSLGVMILKEIFNINILEMKRMNSKIFLQGEAYLRLYNVCHEKCKYLGFEPLMVCLLNLAFRCIRPQEKQRPFLDWVCILLKRLMHLSDEIYQ